MFRALKITAFIFIILFTAYGGAWFFRAHHIKKEVVGLAEQLEQYGVMFSYKSLRVSGFPLLINVQLDDVAVAMEGEQGASTTNIEWVAMRSNMLGTQVTLLISQDQEHYVENNWGKKHYKYHSDIPFVIDVFLSQKGLHLDMELIDKVHLKGHGFDITDVDLDQTIRGAEANDWVYERKLEGDKKVFTIRGTSEAVQWPDTGADAMEGIPTLGKMTVHTDLSITTLPSGESEKMTVALNHLDVKAMDRGFDIAIEAMAEKLPQFTFPTGKGLITISSVDRLVEFLKDARLIQKPQTLKEMLVQWDTNKEDDAVTLSVVRDEDAGLMVGKTTFDEAWMQYAQSQERAPSSSKEPSVPSFEETEPAGGA